MDLRSDLLEARRLASEGEYDELLEGAKSRAVEPIRRRRIHGTLAELEAVDDRSARRIADGFRVALRDSFTAEQRATFERISERTSALQSDETEVTYSFHGPNDEGLTEETYEGRHSTVTVSAFPHCPARYGRLLTALLTQYHAPSVLELGTCLGTSAAYIGTGLDSGHLTTVEAGEPQVEIARETISELGLEERVTVRQGLFQDVLLGDGSVPNFDVAFLDGHHQKEATLEYFDALYDVANEGAIVVFDDVNDYSAGMDEAWDEISADPRVDLSVLTDRVGFAVVNSSISEAERVSLPY
ncbi:O-methyltransferase [Natronococcus roseus]|uniref:O-methyltransferase n=1 Tax=Natronococcus roseus TaxID=1052014 RepID=UPI00374CFC59